MVVAAETLTDATARLIVTAGLPWPAGSRKGNAGDARSFLLCVAPLFDVSTAFRSQAQIAGLQMID